MLSRSQIILLKRAQREAAIDDAEYRDSVEMVSGIPGCRSGKDSRLTDEILDKLLSYFEAIYWRKFDRSELLAQAACKADAVFRQRRYWAEKNTRAVNSRDRFSSGSATDEITDLEAQLAALGFGRGYCGSIRKSVTHGANDAASLFKYRAALKRTLKAKKESNLRRCESDLAAPF